MPLPDLDTIRSTINVLRGELAEANLEGDFANPLADLSDAVHVLGRPGGIRLEFPTGAEPRDLDSIWCDLVEQERLLRRALLDGSDLNAAASVALGDVSRAVNGMIAIFARRQRRGRA